MISVVIPVFNSEGSLNALVQRLEATLRECCDEFELIFVNDGSVDASLAVLLEIARLGDHVTVIDLARNFGQHNALLCGIRQARFPVIVTLDDDLQNPPEEIPKLLEALHDDVDVVYGVPEQQEHDQFRLLGARTVKWALKATMRVDVAKHVQPFRAFRTTLRNAFGSHAAPRISIDVLLSWGTSRFSHVVVKHMPRQSGASNYTFLKLCGHALNMVTGYSVLPLRVASVVGLMLSFFGAVLLLGVVFLSLTKNAAPHGFAFLASVIIIFSGAQMLFLGIIGEYLGRIHSRSMDRPSYVVRDLHRGKLNSHASPVSLNRL